MPPYAIVAGTPARILKYRFEKDEIARLLEIKWWYWTDKNLRECADKFKSVNVFLGDRE